MITEVLLDIDDVCNQCSKYAMQWLGIPFDYENFYEKFPTKRQYDLVGTCNDLLGYDRFTVPSFWSMVPRNFWATCPVSEEFAWILETSEKLVGRENILFLTSPTKDPDCLAGKLEWIIRFAPPWMHRQYSVSPRKRFCATSTALLVDDSDSNIDTFRKKGHGILVPRPWNTLHGVDTMSHLKKEFAEYFARIDAA
jgi:hypothetical protein